MDSVPLTFVLLVLSGAVSLPTYALVVGWLFSFPVGTPVLVALALLGAGLGAALAGIFTSPPD